jgi:rhamnosyltransferase
MSVRASIVIRCYNEAQHIGRLLEAIGRQTLKDLEIIVVDSGSTDETRTIASHYPVKLLSIRPEEFSFGRSLNLGCAAAQGEFVIAASAHVYPVGSDWIERLLNPFHDPRVALVYGKQRGDEHTKYSEHRLFARWFPDVSNPAQEHPFCNNANAALRRSLWLQMPYNETLPGLEDLDWANRVMQAGYRIAYAADATIVHVHNETPSRIYNRYRREAIAFKRIFPNEYFSLWDFVRLFTANVANDWYHAWHDRVLPVQFRSIVVFRLMQFWGTYRGFSLRGADDG